MHGNNCSRFNELKNARNNEGLLLAQLQTKGQFPNGQPHLASLLLHPLWIRVIKCNFIATIGGHSKNRCPWAIKASRPARATKVLRVLLAAALPT